MIPHHRQSFHLFHIYLQRSSQICAWDEPIQIFDRAHPRKFDSVYTKIGQACCFITHRRRSLRLRRRGLLHHQEHRHCRTPTKENRIEWRETKVLRKLCDDKKYAN